MQGSDWREPDKAVLRQELRTRGVNSHLDRSPGSIPAGRERPRFHPKISLWKPYLPFFPPPAVFQESRHAEEEEEEGFAGTSQGFPSQTPSPALPGEGADAFGPFSPPSESPQRWPFAGDWHLSLRQRELAALANELQ